MTASDDHKKRKTERTEDDLVIVDIVSSALDAELAVAALSAAGIEAFLKMDDVGGLLGSLPHVAGVKVLVRAARADEARDILSKTPEEPPPEP